MGWLASLGRWRRLADYLSAAAGTLRENYLLREPLLREHLAGGVPPWTSAPVLNALYPHLSRLALDSGRDVLLVQGLPDTGCAVPVNLWLDGTLGDLDARYARHADGLDRLLRRFEWPGAFRSPSECPWHCPPEHALFYARELARHTPGAVVACLVSAGHAQTCPDAGDAGGDAAWLANDLLDGDAGRVLPVVHGEADASALEAHGYRVLRVEAGARFEARLLESLDESLAALSTGTPWPLIQVITPADLGMPPGLREAPDPAGIEQWLRAYHVEQLLHPGGEPRADVLELAPSGDRRLGMCLLDVARRLRAEE